MPSHGVLYIDNSVVELFKPVRIFQMLFCFVVPRSDLATALKEHTNPLLQVLKAVSLRQGLTKLQIDMEDFLLARALSSFWQRGSDSAEGRQGVESRSKISAPYAIKPPWFIRLQIRSLQFLRFLER